MVLRIFKRAVLPALLGLSVLATGALAGSYHVYACRTPSGEIAPADGWSGSKTGTYTYAINTCQQPGGALIAALGDQAARTANTDVASWEFAAPTNERISGATLWRAGDADGGAAINATYEFWLSGPSENEIFDECAYVSSCMNGKGESGQPFAAENRVVVQGSHLGSHLYVNASCGGVSEYNCPEGKGDPNGYAAVVYLYAADITLEQTAGPSASNVSGELASAPAVSGTSDVTFSASDPGSGVYEAVFSIDGQVVQSTVLDENGGRCKDVGQTTDGLPAYLYIQPCPASVSADVGLDTTKISNGTHHLVVSVIDAAGNAAPVLDRNITIANPTPPDVPSPLVESNASSSGPPTVSGPVATAVSAQPNGTDAPAGPTLTVSWKGARGPDLTSAYGRAQTIVGRLLAPSGAPIAGAQIELLATPASVGAKPVTMASPRTAREGTFTVNIPGGVSSRTLRFAYRAHLGDPAPAVTSTLTLTVDAGVALSITPHTARAGRMIFFSGRLLGGSIPRYGKPLVLEARSRGSAWIEFDVIRSDSRGRFHASYRFRLPGPASYQFRVLSERESDYPFEAGSSNVVGVHEQ